MLGCIQPMSSPMMNTMLGFGCCAAAGAPAVVTATAMASRPSQIVLVMLMFELTLPLLPGGAGSFALLAPRRNLTAIANAART